MSEACPIDVSGFSFAGVPGVVIGHNADIAWGITNLGPDVSDFFLERVIGDTYLRDGTWQPITSREEVIKVAGGADQRFTVRTTVHGPVLSDVVDGLADAGSRAPTEQEGDETESYAVSLAWTGLIPGRTADAILDLDLATDFEAFRQAARSFAVPSQNLLYADTQGHIGYQAPGQVPIRRPALPRTPAGYWPAPGWDSTYDWQGFVEFSELPWALDPKDGVIVAANQAVTTQLDSLPHLGVGPGVALGPDRRAARGPAQGRTRRHGRHPARHPGLLREGARAGVAGRAARGVRGRPRRR